MSETQTMADVSDERLAQTIADVDAPGINIPDWLREHLRRALTELQARRAADAAQPGEEEEVRKYLDEARDKFHVLGCNFAEASPERVCAFELRDEAASLLERLSQTKVQP